MRQPLPEQEKRIRKPGGGRKSVLSTAEGLEDAFFEMLKIIRRVRLWMPASNGQIRGAKKWREHGFTVSVTVIDQLLAKHNFRARQAFKAEAGKKNIPR